MNIEIYVSLFISVRLAERSKAIGLSPMTFKCAGSNPAPNINKFYELSTNFTRYRHILQESVKFSETSSNFTS